MHKLIIFDIDEVLVKKGSNNALGNRLPFAVSKVFGISTKIDPFPASGMTDTSIMIKIAKLSGISKSTATKNLNKLYKEAIEYSRKHIKEHKATVYKGVRPLLKRLKKEDFIICLATGNLEPIARLKLRKVGINNYFKFGGFGTSWKRADLIRDAIKQAQKKYGKIKKSDMFYFGDSPLDVKGGKAAGVNMMAVATGKYSIKELAKEKPNYLLKDLTNINKILEIINTSSQT